MRTWPAGRTSSSPRGTSEGVGLTFLEALGRGCAVFAYDAPTMSEYIAHGENGFLLRRRGRSLWSRAAAALERRLGSVPPHPVSGRQDWGALRRLDLRRLGDEARRS
ncbi:MAG: glycosyltransferase [Anaerolineales bacterium]|nr:glycosyltransferase [Anaerolineales bacterium]